MANVTRKAHTLLVAAMVCALTFCLNSLAAAETVRAPLSLKSGDIFELDISSERSGGFSAVNATIRTRERIEVIDTGPDGATVRLTLVSHESDASDPVYLTILNALYEQLLGKAFMLDLDRSGRPIRARAWRAILETGKAAAKAQVAAGNESFPLQAIDRAFDDYLSLDDAAAARKIGDRLALWTSRHDVALANGQSIEHVVSYPNPFGGDPVELRSDATPVIGAKSITIIESQESTPAGVTAMLDAILAHNRMPTERQDELMQSLVIPPSLRIQLRIIIDRSTGWTQSADQTTRVRAGVTHNVTDKMSVVLVRP